MEQEGIDSLCPCQPFGDFRLFSFCVCLKYAVWSLSDVGHKMSSVRDQTSTWNIAYVAVLPFVTRLLNCVFAVGHMQLRKELIIELIRAVSCISG